MATERLLETMAELKRQGVAQIIISHRLNDIFAVGDRVMVLKRGENVGERCIEATDEREVLEIIVSAHGIEDFGGTSNGMIAIDGSSVGDSNAAEFRWPQKNWPCLKTVLVMQPSVDPMRLRRAPARCEPSGR